MPATARLRFHWFLAVFLALSLFSASMSWLFTVRTGASMWTLQPDASATAWYVVAMNLVYWGSWAPLAPLVLLVAARWRLDVLRWRQSVPVHVIASFGVACLHIVVVATGRTVLQRAVGMQVSWEDRAWEMFFRTIDWELTLYWALVALQHAVNYYDEIRARDLREAQLETRLVEAQLQALQGQLHPHFLFNTLHAISALIYREPEKADTMIERLSDLLRVTLDKVGIQRVTLEEELAYLQAYLDIEQVHFGDRLEIVYRIDAHTLDVLVPNLILQPLAENAIRHGLEPRAVKGRLTIEASRDGDRLVLRVADNGRGLRVRSADCGVRSADDGVRSADCGVRRADDGARSERTAPGVGLSNARSRLERLYGDEAALDIASSADGGVVATITIPFSTASETSAPLSHAAVRRRTPHIPLSTRTPHTALSTPQS